MELHILSNLFRNLHSNNNNYKQCTSFFIKNFLKVIMATRALQSDKTAINRDVTNYTTTGASSIITSKEQTPRSIIYPQPNNILTSPLNNASNDKSINSSINSSSSTNKRKTSLSSLDDDFCCCIFSNYRRQQFCLNLLYLKSYSLSYFIILLIMITSFIYDLLDLKIDNKTFGDQPLWFVILNMICLLLMFMDILIHIQAFKSIFFNSIINWLDFLFVIICVGISPLFWYAPAYILQLLLFLRFLVRLLRRHTFRKQYVSARNVIVDFTKFEQNEEEQRKYTDFANGDAV